MPIFNLNIFRNSQLGRPAQFTEDNATYTVVGQSESIGIADDDAVFDDQGSDSGQTVDNSSQVLAEAFRGAPAGQVVQSVARFDVANTTTGQSGFGYVIVVLKGNNPASPPANTPANREGEFLMAFTIPVAPGNVLTYSNYSFVGQVAYASLFPAGNAAPVTVDDTATTSENMAVILNVLANDSAPDGDTVTIDEANIRAGASTPPGTSNNGLSNDGGQLRFDPTAYVNPVTGVRGFDYLGVGQTATILIDYNTEDSRGAESTPQFSTVTLTITGTNDGPVAVDDTNTVREDDSATAVVTGNVLANDTDVDGGSTRVVANPGTYAGAFGTLTLNADGSYSYVANDDLIDTLSADQNDVFTYTVSDGQGGSDSATLTIAIDLADDNAVINGGAGSQTLSGDRTQAGSEDTIDGKSGDDRLFGLDGADTLIGGTGDDRLDGGSGRDTLLGGTGDDRLFGGAGDDVLRGETGDDTMTGGTGADRFVFTRNGQDDTITDFVVGEDRLVLEGLTIRTVRERDVDRDGDLDTVVTLSSGNVTLLDVRGGFTAGDLTGATPPPAVSIAQSMAFDHAPVMLVEHSVFAVI